MPAPLLVVDDLRLHLPGPRAWLTPVDGVSFTLARGETLGLIGESGCGKSLTALALAGLQPAAARVTGSIRFDGMAVVNAPERSLRRVRGARIGFVFQEPMTALNPLQTVGAQVAEPLRLHRGLARGAARAEALRLLERVRLPNAAQRLDAYPHQLSGGQRQRVLIAAAVAAAPDLLIADEPTTALDAGLQREVLALLRELVDEAGMALLLISHDLALVAEHVQRVAVMYAGRWVDDGPTAAVFGRQAHPYTRALVRARPRIDARPGERLPVISGRVPAPDERPPGCPYAGRCPREIGACRQALPPLQALDDPAHRVRCIRPFPAPAAAREDGDAP